MREKLMLTFLLIYLCLHCMKVNFEMRTLFVDTVRCDLLPIMFC